MISAYSTFESRYPKMFFNICRLKNGHRSTLLQDLFPSARLAHPEVAEDPLRRLSAMRTLNSLADLILWETGKQGEGGSR